MNKNEQSMNEKIKDEVINKQIKEELTKLIINYHSFNTEWEKYKHYISLFDKSHLY